MLQFLRRAEAYLPPTPPTCATCRSKGTDKAAFPAKTAWDRGVDRARQGPRGLWGYGVMAGPALQADWTQRGTCAAHVLQPCLQPCLGVNTRNVVRRSPPAALAAAAAMLSPDNNDDDDDDDEDGGLLGGVLDFLGFGGFGSPARAPTSPSQVRLASAMDDIPGSGAEAPAPLELQEAVVEVGSTSRPATSPLAALQPLLDEHAAHLLRGAHISAPPPPAACQWLRPCRHRVPKDVCRAA